MRDKHKGTDMERITVKDVRPVFERLQRRLPHLHLVLDEGSKTYGRAWRIHHIPDGETPCPCPYIASCPGCRLAARHDRRCPSASDHACGRGHYAVPGHTSGGYLGMTAREAYDALHNLLYGMDMFEAASPDRAALDRIAYLLRAEEWPGASGMEDVAEIVAATGRDLTPDPSVEWPRH